MRPLGPGLPDGNTLVGCTHGNLIVELDPAGKEVWRLTNDDLPGKPWKRSASRTCCFRLRRRRTPGERPT